MATFRNIANEPINFNHAGRTYMLGPGKEIPVPDEDADSLEAAAKAPDGPPVERQA